MVVIIRGIAELALVWESTAPSRFSGLVAACGWTFALSSPTLIDMSRYAKANHRIFMRFVRRDVWHVTFLEPGLQTPLPKTLTFRDEGKIRELARRGEAWQTSEDRQMLDYAIAKGEGGVYLRLSPGQYARLRRP
jgi:hypothetical protein